MKKQPDYSTKRTFDLNYWFRIYTVLVLVSMLINACQPKPDVPATESPLPAEKPTPTNAGIPAVDDGSPLPPAIIAQNPARGMELALSGEISLTFSLPMDTEKTGA